MLSEQYSTDFTESQNLGQSKVLLGPSKDSQFPPGWHCYLFLPGKTFFETGKPSIHCRSDWFGQETAFTSLHSIVLSKDQVFRCLRERHLCVGFFNPFAFKKYISIYLISLIYLAGVWDLYVPLLDKLFKIIFILSLNLFKYFFRHHY